MLPGAAKRRPRGKHLDCCGMECPSREMQSRRVLTKPEKRNGASLAADPTLTGGGLRRALYARRLMPAQRPLRGSNWLLVARRSRRCRFRRGPGSIARTCPLPPGGSETVFRRPGPDSGLGFARKLHQFLGTRPAIRPADFAPSRSQRSGIWSAPGRTFERSAFHFLLRAAFAIASKRFQNPFSVAGLSAFVSEGPIPVSMSGR